jgi:[ribosomal protein S5]-alanine N-acetyltransferase
LTIPLNLVSIGEEQTDHPVQACEVTVHPPFRRSQMLTTPRLEFRYFVPPDLDRLYEAIYRHPEVARELSPTGSLSLQQTAALLERRIQHWYTHGFGAWALIHKQDQQLIGHCGLHNLTDISEQPEVELTYALSPAYWQQGLATEAAQAVLAWGFETLEFTQIAAVTGPRNLTSQRVLQKLGMQYERNISYSGTEVRYYVLARLDFCLNQISSTATHRYT